VERFVPISTQDPDMFSIGNHLEQAGDELGDARVKVGPRTRLAADNHRVDDNILRSAARPLPG